MPLLASLPPRPALYASMPALPVPALFSIHSQTPTESPTPPPAIEPVPLPDPALPDSAYRTDLADLLSDPEKRRGVLTALLHSIRRDETPAHAPTLVALLIQQLNTGNPLETVLPIRVLGRCGASARPAFARVVTLSNSPLDPVRTAAAESLGGMFAASTKGGGTATVISCPPAVTATLLRLAQRDSNFSTQRAALVALGRTHVATEEVLETLNQVILGTDTDLALAALFSAQQLGADGHPLLPAIKKRLVDGQTVANAVPALQAMCKPQQGVDALAKSLAEADDFTVQQVIVYYAGKTPTDKGLDTAALAAAVKPLMAPGSAGGVTQPSAHLVAGTAATAGSTTSVTAPPQGGSMPTVVMPASDDAAHLRLAAAQSYLHLSADPTDGINGLAVLASDTTVAPAIRRSAILTLGTRDKATLTTPTVVSALKITLADPDPDLQEAVIRILSRISSPKMGAVAPRLCTLLLTAWKAGQNARVFTLLNTVYRIGDPAKAAAVPVLTQIIQGEPTGSENAKLASLALAHFTAP